ncbi:MAG: FtsW/RodA/SpoVE family cell cycle protein [Bacteroidales bacterium]|nr:FtsW/RodA/SpoVE family cell cycle protein [Bacteroidales bacterium]
MENEVKHPQSGESKKGIWNFIDRIQGDKVIWIVFILLILYSLIVNFSATSLKATIFRTRLDIFREHILFVIGAFLIVFIIYFLIKVGFLRVLSQLGFWGSMVMLGMLLAGYHTVVEDSAARSIHLFGFDIQVFEFVKIFMVMYLSWAVHAYKTDSFHFINFLTKKVRPLRFLAHPLCKRLIYIHLPIVLVTLGIMVNGFSSAVFTAVIMIVTVLVGGIPWKDIFGLAVLVAVAVLLSYAAWKVTDSSALGRRWETVESRVAEFLHPKKLSDLEPRTREWREFLDAHRQEQGALLAIRSGGLFGKGAGKSTQKQAIAEMYSDYAFAFIVEEYGILFGALPLIALYVCLIGRGAIISRYCSNDFCKTAVAGLTLLISGQAMLHILVNVKLFPLTGQTLPLVSYGRSSLLMFAAAFGVLLAISKSAKEQVDEAEAAAPPLVERDDVQAAMDDLEMLESLE